MSYFTAVTARSKLTGTDIRRKGNFWLLEGDHKRWWFLSMAQKCVANASWPLLVSNHSFLFWRLWASPAAVGWFVMPFQLPSTAQLLSHFSRASQARKMTAKRLTSACAPVGLWPTARHCGSCFSFFNGCRPVDWTRYCFCTLWAELILWFSQNTTNSHWQNRSDPENTYITYYILG